MIVVVLLLVTFGRTIVDFLQNKYMGLSTTINIIINLRLLWQILILFAVFWLMYIFVPNRKVKFRTQIPGAAFAAIGWYVLSWAFSIYLDVFKNFSVIYAFNDMGILEYVCLTTWCRNKCINRKKETKKYRFKMNRYFFMLFFSQIFFGRIL